MDNFVFVFFYAERMDRLRGIPAQMPGELRLRHNGDGAAKYDPESLHTVKGELHVMNRRLFDRLAGAEHGGSADDYEPEEVTLVDGQKAIAFTFQGSDTEWRTFRTIPSGDWRTAPGHR